ncbi:Tyrosine protein kinase:Serine/threonine protein kinase [Janibacter sp. HTCC2649]|uniref:serine/threonine-protein kinase n=1 Tax=Janibacter sp. HTCC2649 TaxID=313589 RepID=UPI00006711D2|nr:serine/threonine-protein kinase [Janibacter sp. HTCC2649]EAP97100.1 Tyrosine protein kinase:Serine/threonine protein kinase [Janibacter sp. HTCC2649]
MTAEILDDSGGRDGLPEHSLLGSYRLVQRLGEGGMGVVHLGLDRHGKAVAIKVLRPHVAHDPAARARLTREVETLRRIRSPRVAPVIDADVDGERPFIVTRYVPGPPLDEVVSAHGPMGPDDLHRLGRGLAEALDVIHASDVIHRDLKPGNVLIVDGDPVVIDFGIAHVADDIRLTMTGLVMGTPGYLAPEVVEGSPVSTATDWWGWAATLAYAASGRPPFGRGPMDAVLTRVTTGEPDLAGVDKRIAPLLYAALAPVPQDRPHQREVVAALEKYAHGGLVTDIIKVRRPTPPTQALAMPRTAVLPLSRNRTQPSRPAVAPAVMPAVVPLVAQRPTPAEALFGPPLGAPQVAPERQLEHPAYPPQEPGQNDWDAARDGQPLIDPRIGRQSRSGTVAALLAVLVATAATAPVVAAIGLLVWIVLARTADRSVTSLIMRRHDKGRRRSDIPVAVVASPWHFLVGVISSLFGAIMPALMAVSGVFCAALAVVAIQGTGSPEPDALAPLAVGGLLAGLMAWWGPGGASLRRGTRSIVRGVSPGPSVSRVLVLLLLVGAVAVAAAGVVNGQPSWWPTGTSWADQLNLP